MAKPSATKPAPAPAPEITPAANPETPPVAPAPTPAPTAAEAAAKKKKGERTDKLVNSLLVSKPEKIVTPTPATPAAAPAATPAVTPATPAAAPVTQPAPAATPAPVTPAPVKVTQRPPAAKPLGAKEIAQIAREVVVQSKTPEPTTPKPADPFESVDDAELKADAPVYAELGKLHADKYGSPFITRLIDWKTKVEPDYIAKWESSHPGTAFEATDKEHDSFYARQPKIAARDWDRAVARLEARAEIEAEFKPQLEKVSELSRTVKQMQAEPEAVQTVGIFTANLFSKVAGTKEGEIVTVEDWKEFEKTNPIAAKVAQEINKDSVPLVRSASLLWDGVEKFNAKNQVHVAARQYAQALEKELSEMPEPLRNEAGQEWVSQAEYAELSDADRARFFTTTKQHVVNYIMLAKAEQVQNLTEHGIKYFEDTAAMLGYQKQPAPNGTAATNGGAAPTPAPVEQPAIRLPVSPTVEAGAPIVPISTINRREPPKKEDLLQIMMH